jgi:hypothetical protein
MAMKIHVIRDQKGGVIGTFERASNADVLIEPELSEGMTVEEVEAPSDYMQNLPTFYKTFEAAGKTKVHVIRGRKGEVIGTFERASNADVLVQPEIGEGMSIEEVEAPADYMQNLSTFYRTFEAASRQ